MAKQPESLHDALHEPLRTGPNFDDMNDEELMAYLANETSQDKYAIPESIIPQGMSYQWVRCEIFGKPDFNRTSEVEQRGWRAVPASRYDGRYMLPGTSGPIVLDGLMLYELPRRVWRLKRTLQARIAKEKVDDMNAQLSYAPTGTGPRVPRTPNQPMVQRESGAMPMVIE